MWFCNSFTAYHVDSSVTFKWHRCPLKPACDLGSEQWFTLKQLETTLEWLRDKFLTVAQPKQTKTLYDIWGCWQVTDLFCDWLIISFEFWQKSKTKTKAKLKKNNFCRTNKQKTWTYSASARKGLIYRKACYRPILAICWSTGSCIYDGQLKERKKKKKSKT